MSIEQEFQNLTNSTSALGLDISISNKAYLVELNISSWAGRKTDKKASSEVNEAYKAEKGTASVRKKLFGNCEELAAIHTFIGHTRNNLHKPMTLPWSDSGIRMLTELAREPYEKSLDETIVNFYALVDTFIGIYQTRLDNVFVESKLGDLFDPSEYPSAESLRSKFSMGYHISPIPEAGDFRVDCAAAEKDRLQKLHVEFAKNQVEAALNDVWKRLYKHLSHLSERLDYGSNEKKKVFKEATLEHVLGMIDVLGMCNVQDDPVMTQLKDDLEKAMRGITTEALREDDVLRLETKRKLDAAIAALPSLN